MKDTKEEESGNISLPSMPVITQPMLSVILNRCVTVFGSRSLSWKHETNSITIVTHPAKNLPRDAEKLHKDA